MGWRMNDDQVISFGERCIFSRLEIHAVFAVFGCYIKVCFCMLLFVLSYIRRTLQDKVTGRHLSLSNLYVLLNLYAGDKCPELRTIYSTKQHDEQNRVDLKQIQNNSDIDC